MGDLFEAFSTRKQRTEFQSIVFIESGETHVREKKDVLTVDATIDQTHNFVATPSTHPIEGGENVVDNVDVKPASLTIRGVMAKEPLTIVSALVGNFAGATNVAIAGRGGVLGGIGGNIVQSQLGGFLQESIYGDRAKDGLESLLTMFAEKRLIDVVTKLRVYKNMIIENISVPHNVGHGDSIEFTATMTGVQLVESETSAIMEKVAATNAPSSAAKADKGHQSTKDVLSQKVNDIMNSDTTYSKKAFDLIRLIGGL